MEKYDLTSGYVHHLVKNVRVERMSAIHPERKGELLDYASWLLKIGNGKVHDGFKDPTKVPTQMICTSTDELEKCFRHLFEKYK